jgi:hypothetical protein
MGDDEVSETNHVVLKLCEVNLENEDETNDVTNPL